MVPRYSKEEIDYYRSNVEDGWALYVRDEDDGSFTFLVFDAWTGGGGLMEAMVVRGLVDEDIEGRTPVTADLYADHDCECFDEGTDGYESLRGEAERGEGWKRADIWLAARFGVTRGRGERRR